MAGILLHDPSTTPSAPLPSVTADGLVPARVPTLYFIGVTTGGSSIQRVFPGWAAQLGLHGARLQGVDLPLGADPEVYRRVVRFIADDPLSLGAQVTTHKIDLFRAAGDLLDELDPLATLMGEVSCIVQRDGRLLGAAKDAVTSGLALDAFVPADHWERSGRQALVLGAGGAGVAITWNLTRPDRGADRPSEVVVTDTDPSRLRALEDLHRTSGAVVRLRTVLVGGTDDADEVLESLTAGSLVVNATGLGKDRPGSPLGAGARFPVGAFAWELNYRGDLQFLSHARSQGLTRQVQTEDGWVYFLHGWLQTIGAVFDVEVPTDGVAFRRLSEVAIAAR